MRLEIAGKIETVIMNTTDEPSDGLDALLEIIHAEKHKIVQENPTRRIRKALEGQGWYLRELPTYWQFNFDGYGMGVYEYAKNQYPTMMDAMTQFKTDKGI